MMISWTQQMIDIQELFLTFNVTSSENLYNLKDFTQEKDWGEGTTLERIELYDFTVNPYTNKYTSMAALIGALLAFTFYTSSLLERNTVLIDQTNQVAVLVDHEQ